MTKTCQSLHTTYATSIDRNFQVNLNKKKEKVWSHFTINLVEGRKEGRKKFPFENWMACIHLWKSIVPTPTPPCPLWNGSNINLSRGLHNQTCKLSSDHNKYKTKQDVNPSPQGRENKLKYKCWVCDKKTRRRRRTTVAQRTTQELIEKKSRCLLGAATK